jgi:hypothetical protein
MQSGEDSMPNETTSFTPVGASKDIVTLWRPVGPRELKLIRQADMRAFPPRLPGQQIFYPVSFGGLCCEDARDWNVPASGSGFVARFQVQRSFLDNYSVQQAGGSSHLEYWIPAEDLVAFNRTIVGVIEIVAEFH